VQSYRGIAAARAGDRAVAEAMDRQIAARDDPYRRSRITFALACTAAELGELDRAVELLYETTGHAFSLHAPTFLEPLRGYPPFEELRKPKG
jgi:hypothetical protein